MSTYDGGPFSPAILESNNIPTFQRTVHYFPHIRKLAPWIPSACISIWLSRQPEIIGRLSVADFDAVYPKSIITMERNESIKDKKHTDSKVSTDSEFRTHPEFNQQRWEKMLNEMMIKRVASMTGRTVKHVNSLLENSSEIEFVLSTSIKEKLNEHDLEKFKKGLVLMDFGGTKISVDEIISGFSEVNVVKVGVYRNDSKGQTHSYWLIKWGTSIRKLSEEVSAHRLMFKGGLNRRLLVPQLYPNVLYWDGFGFIAYEFEKDALTALELIQQESINSLKSHLKVIADNLYSGASLKPFSPSEELSKWCGLDIDKQEIIKDDLLKHPMEITGSLIHGDFHLRNILIKDNSPTLIDFARSDFGPVAVDLAKLVIDILVFCAQAEIKAEVFKWDYLIKKSSLSEILRVYENYLKEKDDKKFFEIALLAYANKYITYADVDEPVKDSLRKAIKCDR